MCQAYPRCPHKGKVMKKKNDVLRRCETNLENTVCPYLQFGCLGCTFKEIQYTRHVLSQYMSIRGQNIP